MSFRRIVGLLPALLPFLLVALVSSTPSASAAPVVYQLTEVADAGNAANAGKGRVTYEYEIGIYEWTNSQYTSFLNAVDPAGTNLRSLYNANMGTSLSGGISFNPGAAAGSKYAVRTNMGSKPVNFVSWFDAARVANWMGNGQGSGDTETGSYTLVANQISGVAPGRNNGDFYYIPTENEWYKSAYYKAGGTSAGYWTYATMSNSIPTATTADATGSGNAGLPNAANYGLEANWNGTSGGNVTTVGSNGGTSAYGTYDQSGNVLEWNDLTGAAGASKGVFGGGFASTEEGLRTGTSLSADTENEFLGFRLMSVPEIDPAGLSSVLAMVTGALALVERRRRRNG